MADSQQALSAFLNEQIPVIQQRIAATPIPEPKPATARTLAQAIDHTLLKADATKTQVAQLCDEAATHGFASVCVNASWVPFCAEALAEAESVVCTVVGFPLGATLTAAKVAETEAAIAAGAQEIDMVINIGQLKDGAYQAVFDDIAAVVAAAQRAESHVLVKVIIETCLLTEEEKIAASLLTQKAGADFVKTSTGFSTGGATLADVHLMRQTVGPEMGIKAAGGVRTAEDAFHMFAAGATRIGASAGVKIMQSLQENADKAQPSDASSDNSTEGKSSY